MIEKQLRLAVIERKRVVDHHEVHVGVAPVNQRVAVQKKRGRHRGHYCDQSPTPSKKCQPVESVRAGLRLIRRGPGGSLVHAGDLSGSEMMKSVPSPVSPAVMP